MKKILLSLIIITFLSSCGASKKASIAVSRKSKLEKEYRRFKGVKYKYGGTDRRGFDCSGFVQTVYRNAFKVQLPRTTKVMGTQGRKVLKSQLKIGDLVFFKTSRKSRHVGIYIDKNTFIHSSTSKGIIKSKLDNVYWKKKYRFSRRVLK